jgi:hypothetical protein
MSALTDAWLAVHTSSVACQKTVLDIASAELEGDTRDRDLRVAAFQATQDAQLATLDAQIQALAILLQAVTPP